MSTIINQLDLNELFNFIADLFSLPIVIIVLRNKNIPKHRLFYVGLILVIASHFFTIIESLYLPRFYNFLEHLSYFFAGLLFLLGVIKYFIKTGDGRIDRSD